jgi:predicted TIM-barrel fold metal-dependent hydrolase
MIIDCHTHVTFKSPDLPYAQLEILLEVMERVGLDKTCLIPWPRFETGYFFHSEEDTIKIAETIINVIKTYKDKFFTLLWLNPILSTDFNIKVIEKYVINGPINGVKAHIQMNARDKRMEPLAEALEKYDVPILFHAWYKTVEKNIYESDPSDIADLAMRFPDLRILMAHLSGCRKRGVQDIKKHKNISIDTSGSQPEDGFLEYAIKELGTERILFGSDFIGRDIATQLGRIYSVDLEDKKREEILSKNALRFFDEGGVKG